MEVQGWLLNLLVTAYNNWTLINLKLQDISVEMRITCFPSVLSRFITIIIFIWDPQSTYNFLLKQSLLQNWLLLMEVYTMDFQLLVLQQLTLNI